MRVLCGGKATTEKNAENNKRRPLPPPVRHPPFLIRYCLCGPCYLK